MLLIFQLIKYDSKTVLRQYMEDLMEMVNKQDMLAVSCATKLVVAQLVEMVST